MTGAGSATVAWAPEDSYLGGTSSPTYREPGTNVQVQTAELSRNLLEILAPDDPEAQAFLAQNIEGQLGVSWILKNDDFHRFTFNDSFTTFTSGTVNSAEWYLGVDYIGGTTERQVKGWVPASVSIEYSGTTEAVRVTVSGPYGDEVPGHGADLQIDGTSVAKLQTATIQFENISRLQRGPDPRPLEAVQGNVTETVDMTAIYDGPSRYELALGGTGVTSTQDSMSAVPATVSFDIGGTTVADYTFERVKPDTYDWQDLVNADADLNESITFNARGVTASDPTV
jgi:hypothetical protein